VSAICVVYRRKCSARAFKRCGRGNFQVMRCCNSGGVYWYLHGLRAAPRNLPATATLVRDNSVAAVQRAPATEQICVWGFAPCWLHHSGCAT
jgi:hypothetical protein